MFGQCNVVFHSSVFHSPRPFSCFWRRGRPRNDTSVYGSSKSLPCLCHRYVSQRLLTTDIHIITDALLVIRNLFVRTTPASGCFTVCMSSLSQDFLSAALTCCFHFPAAQIADGVGPYVSLLAPFIIPHSSSPCFFIFSPLSIFVSLLLVTHLSGKLLSLLFLPLSINLPHSQPSSGFIFGPSSPAGCSPPQPAPPPKQKMFQWMSPSWLQSAMQLSALQSRGKKKKKKKDVKYGTFLHVYNFSSLQMTGLIWGEVSN